MSHSNNVGNGYSALHKKHERAAGDEPSVKKIPQNPFIQKLRLTTLDKLQVALMSILICPLRLLLVVLMLSIGYVFARISLWGYDRQKQQTEPLSRWRNFLRPVSVFFCRMMFFVGGFHWVTERGERVGSDVAPILVAGPHTTFFDALVIIYLGLTSVVAKKGTEEIPLIGTITQYTQPILVHREDPNSRVNTVREIQRRAAAGGKWPQVIIFPEGTCTNQSCLINYKPGAFIPAVPVQPVCLKYSNRMNTTSWTWKGPAALKILWLTVANFSTKLEIEFLPVYTPNEEEKKDPVLFGQNVRAVMSKARGLPMVDYTYEDGLAMTHSVVLPVSDKLTHINSLVRPLNLTSQNLQELVEGLISGGGLQQHVGFEVFASRMNISHTSYDLLQLYNYYTQDQTQRGHSRRLYRFSCWLCDLINPFHTSCIHTHSDNGKGIDMRVFAVHMAMLTRSYDIAELFRLAFQIYDEGNKGFLSIDEMKSLLKSVELSEKKFPVIKQTSYEGFMLECREREDCARWFPSEKKRARKRDQTQSASENREKMD